MHRTQTLLLLGVLGGASSLALAECGNSPNDGGDANPDATPTDVAFDNIAVSDAADAQSNAPDADASFPYPPAVWSLRIEHVGYADLGSAYGGVACVAAEGSVGADFGLGPLGSPATVTSTFGLGDGGSPFMPASLGINAHPGTRITGDLNAVPGQTWYEIDLQNLQQRSIEVAFGCSKDFFLSPKDYYVSASDAAAPRYHHALDKGDIKAADSLSGGMMLTPIYDEPGGFQHMLTPGELIVGSGGLLSAVGVELPGSASPISVAVDAVSGYAIGNVVVIAGRMQGSFDFGNGTTTADGYFIVGLNPADLSVKWLKILGGTPVQSAAVGPSAAEGASIRISEATGFVVTLPFSGTINLGSNQLTAPSSGQATAIFGMDVNGSVSWSKAFAKGPASAGKLSRPSVGSIPTGYRLFDTVWDTMAFGGTIVTSNQGADVVVADLDAQGNLLSYRLYGGPGDDEAYRIRVRGNECYLLGHSQQAIDFGNGALSTSATEGEIWLARLAP